MGAWELIIGIHIPCWIASIVIGYKKNRLIAGIFWPWLLTGPIGLLIMLLLKKKGEESTTKQEMQGKEEEPPVSEEKANYI